MPSFPAHVAPLAHLAGFVAGAALYGMLLLMTLRERRGAADAGGSGESATWTLPLVTGVLGLTWNVAALVFHAGVDFGVGSPPVALTTIGFCPSARSRPSSCTR